MFNKYYLGARVKAAGAFGVKGRSGHPGINNWYVIRCIFVSSIVQLSLVT